jgi:uncharacterized protein (PEP-CTERM system associated)
VAAPLITPGIDVQQSYNDNVNLQPSGQAQADWITTITPSLAVSEDAARVKFNLIYNPQMNLYYGDTSQQVLQQNLTSSGEVVLYPDMFFFDEQAAINQQFVGIGAPAAATTLTTNGNLQTVQSFNLTPIMKQHLGSITDSDTRFVYGQVSTSGNLIAPVQNTEARQVFTSGAYFGRLGWTLTGDMLRNKSETSANDPLGGTSFKDTYGRAEATYPITAGISGLASVGYEKVTDPTITSNTQGLTWYGGFQYRPSQTTSVRLTYGRRYNGTDIEFSTNYDIGPQTHFTASYSQNFQTNQGAVGAALSQISFVNGIPINAQTGIPFNGGINPLTGTPLSPEGLSSGAVLVKAFQATLTATRGRNTYSGGLFYDHQSQESPASSARTFGGNLNWGRNLRPDLDSNLGFTYSHNTGSVGTIGGTGATTNFVTLSAGLTYSLSQTANVRFNLQRSMTTSSAPGSDINDDVVSVAFHKQF